MTNVLRLIFLYIVWGTTYTAISFALKGFTPFTMASMRFLLCGLILLPLTKKEDWNLKYALPHILGGICLTFSNSLVVWSQQNMPSGLAALFVATVPLWFMLLNWGAFEKKRPGLISFIGLMVGLLGVGYLSYASGKDLTMRTSAIVLIIGSLIWCFGSLIIRKAQRKYETSAAISVQLTTGGIFLIIPALLTHENIASNFHQSSWTPVFGWLYLVVFGSLLAMSAYNKLLSSFSPHVVGTYALVNPVVAMLLGQVYLGESLTHEMLVATLLVLGGVGIIILSNFLKEKVHGKVLEPVACKVERE